MSGTKVLCNQREPKPYPRDKPGIPVVLLMRKINHKETADVQTKFRSWFRAQSEPEPTTPHSQALASHIKPK